MNRLVRPLFVAIVCCCCAATAHASGARLFALGGDGAFVEDAVNGRVWFGSLVDHGGWLAVQSGPFTGEQGYARDPGTLRRASGPAVGLHLPVGRDGRHGTFALWHDGRADGGGAGELADDRLEGAWQVMFARDLGAGTWGLSLRHAGVDDKRTAGLHRKATRDEFGLGVRIDVTPRAYLDLAGDAVRLADETALDPALPDERSAADCYGLRARAFVQAGGRLVLVPVLEHRQERRDWNPLGGADRRSHRLWRAGGGLTWLPDPDRLVLLAADWRETRVRDDGAGLRAITQVLALRLAAEARVDALFSLRASVAWRTGDTGADPAVRAGVGLSAHLGAADLDLALATAAPVNPGSRLEPWSGREDSSWMSAGLSWWF